MKNNKIIYTNMILLLFIFLLNFQVLAQKSVVIDSDFPGGNIIVNNPTRGTSYSILADGSIDYDSLGGSVTPGGVSNKSTSYYDVSTAKNDTIYLQPDLRDTKGDWFYWDFRIRGAAGQDLTFKFPLGKIAEFGPAFSTNEGESWQWLYDNPRSNQRLFSYSFGKDENEVRFSMGMPYVQSDFDDFIGRFKNNPYLSIKRLTTSPKGRKIDKVLIENPSNTFSKYKVAITVRHHACEMMPNYELEGIIKSILKGNNKNMKWLREKVAFFIVPFVDKDGVQDGDQGKNRRPRDHNRDYIGKSIYTSTAAIRNQLPRWGNGELKVALDLHAPGLRDDHIYLVGSSEEKIEKEQIKFANILSQQGGELNFQPDDILKFGTGWNDNSNYNQGLDFTGWTAQFEGISLATGIEFPYADVRGQKVTSQSARSFGKGIADALAVYLKGL